MNHRRNISRRPRGPRRRRRGRRGKHAAQALAAGAAIAAGTQAYADPVRWDNPGLGEPGHFDWAVPGAATGLDVRQGPAAQPAGGSAPSVFEQYVDDAGDFGVLFAPTGGGVEVGGYLDLFLSPVYPAGHMTMMIPSGAAWNEHGYISYPYLGSLLPEGARVYLGLNFALEDGTHFGWISVARNSVELEAYAWGYETEPWVGISGPEPGTLLMLAVGAAVVGRRKRQ